MIVPIIEINNGNGLSVSKLQIKLDQETEGNDLVVRCDGLYVSGGTVSEDGTGNVKLAEYQSNYSIMVDWSPWASEYTHDNDQYKNHVTCDCKTHRIWTAEWDSDDEETRLPINLTGKNPNDPFRPEIDWVLPGDFFRIKKSDDTYDYYIITEVTTGPTINNTHAECSICPKCGQMIHSEEEEPEICPECGQVITCSHYYHTDEDAGNEGLPGNGVAAYAYLGEAGEC